MCDILKRCGKLICSLLLEPFGLALELFGRKGKGTEVVLARGGTAGCGVLGVGFIVETDPRRLVSCVSDAVSD